MIVVRRALALVATLWLCSQAASMTLSAAVIGMLPLTDGALQCTCAHAAGDSAFCPMHHHSPASPVASATPDAAMPSTNGHQHQHMSHDSQGAPASQGTATKSSDNGGTCHMRSGDTASGAALVSVFGPLGLLAPSMSSVAPAIVTYQRVPRCNHAIDRVLPPEPPPPRA